MTKSATTKGLLMIYNRSGLFAKQMFRFCLFLVVCICATVSDGKGQQDNYIAIIPPFMDRFHDNEWGGPLELTQQRFIIFLNRNAAVIYSEADFNNSAPDSQTVELALPSTGFKEGNAGETPYRSNGILGVQFWAAGERANSELKDDGEKQWITLNVNFPPAQSTKVKALFWVETSLADVDSLPGLDTVQIQSGKRGLLVNLDKAAIWKNDVSSIEVQVVFKEGLNPRDTLTVDPDNYDIGDSTLTWTFANVEPTAEDNVSISYNSARENNSRLDTMEKLSAFIVKLEYDNLLRYVAQMDEE